MSDEYLKNVVTLSLDTDKCTGCGTCLEVCARDVFDLSQAVLQIKNRDRCIECGACQKNCPADALSVSPGVGCATAMINRMLGRSKVDDCSCKCSC